MKIHKRFVFWNTYVNLLSINDLNLVVIDELHKKSKSIIANHNLHSLYLKNIDSKFDSFYKKAKFIHIDGMGVWFLCKLNWFNHLKAEHRVTYLDWYKSLFDLLNKDKNVIRLYYLGGTQLNGALGVQYIKEKYPNLEMKWHHGFFDKNSASAETILVVDDINSFKPNLLLVGMGMPIQEGWIMNNYESIRDVDMILNTGALFSYLSGEERIPPRILGRIGLEWLYRLINNPKKLWERYLLEPLKLLYLYAKYKVSKK